MSKKMIPGIQNLSVCQALLIPLADRKRIIHKQYCGNLINHRTILTREGDLHFVRLGKLNVVFYYMSGR